MNRKVLLIVGGLVGLCMMAFAVMIVSGLREEAAHEASDAALRALYNPVKPVCAGGAAAEAAVYTDDGGIHPIATLLSGGGDTWYVRAEDFPEAWSAENVANIELVACMVNDTVLVESCHYTIEDGSTGTVERHQARTTIALYTAQTGTLIDRIELTGPMPPVCVDEESFTEGQTIKTYSGGLTSNEEKVAWLKQYVERP